MKHRVNARGTHRASHHVAIFTYSALSDPNEVRTRARGREFSSIAAGAFGRRDIGYRSKTEDYAAPRGTAGPGVMRASLAARRGLIALIHDAPRHASRWGQSPVEGRLDMKNLHGGRILLATVATIAGVGLAACGGGVAPVENRAAADEVAAAWANAFDAGDATAVAALYAEDAHSMPPGTGTISGRQAIESCWRQDIAAGGIVTKLTPNDSIAQGDLLHVDGTYEVSAKGEGVTLAKGQYQQLWRRIGGQWKVQHEIWRLDPLMQRNPETAQRLAALWTTAYNAGDAKGLTALYDKEAILAPRPAATWWARTRRFVLGGRLWRRKTHDDADAERRLHGWRSRPSRGRV